VHSDEFLLDPNVVFLNHGSFGACPRPVFERYQTLQRELEREPIEFLDRRLPELLAVGSRADRTHGQRARTGGRS
jgi:isopenicillin-N epimerase